MSDVPLETERLILRRLGADDADDLVELDADPLVMRFISDGAPTSRVEMSTDVLPGFLSSGVESHGYGFWAAIERSSSEFVGWFHLRPGANAPRDEPELGYRLRRAAWGRGLATEGSRALIERAFTELGASRVTASTLEVNRASRRVMEKAGLRLARSFNLRWPDATDGEQHAAVEYALTREEWEAAPRPAA